MITKLLASVVGLVFLLVATLSVAPDLLTGVELPLQITMMEGIVHLIFGLLLLFGVWLAARTHTVLQVLSLMYVGIAIVGMDTFGQKVMELADGVATARWVQVALALVLVMLAFMAGSASRQHKAKEVAKAAERASASAASAATAATAAATAATTAATAVANNGAPKETPKPANANTRTAPETSPKPALGPGTRDADARPDKTAMPFSERNKTSSDKGMERSPAATDKPAKPLAERLERAFDNGADAEPAEAPGEKPENKAEPDKRPTMPFGKTPEPQTQS